METVFLQPQALVVGVPVAGVGAVVMAAQFTNMAGATSSHRIKARFGEARVLYTAPLLIVAGLLLLAAFQILPALLFVALISFATALLRPVVMSRIQHELPDNVRATVFSMQSLMFALLLGVGEPLLGYVADLSGLPAAYVGLAGALTILFLLLFWKGRHYFP
jgi:predicted MFS family arabinose efflux permease